MPGRMQLQQSVLLALPGRFSTAPACDLAARPGDLALPLGQACRRRGVVGKCGLTIHSSRTRFAGRLNSGVMLHRDFPVGASHATICAYFWAGIAVGILPFQQAKEWAFAVVAALEAPPIEIIEVATSNERNGTLDALQSAAGGADQHAAGRWLLSDLSGQLAAGGISPMEAARAAMRVAQTTGLPDQVYYDFDALDDELHLAVNGDYGTPEEIGTDILKALKEHAGAT